MDGSRSSRYDNEVQDSFCRKDQPVPKDSVLNSANDSHRADTYRQGSCNKRINEILVFCVPRFYLKPFPKTLEQASYIDGLPNQCSQSKVNNTLMPQAAVRDD